MDRLIHTALAAMRGLIERQGSIAHNLANVAPPGFRADLANAAALPLDDAPGRPSARVLPAEAQVGIGRRQGALSATGRGLDIALSGDALLAVRAADGAEAYTRRSDLSVSPGGQLVTGEGQPVLGIAGPLTVDPARPASIAANGQLFQADPADPAAAPVAVGQLKLVASQGIALVKRLDGLITPAAGGTLPADADATLIPGTLKGSNVAATTAETLDEAGTWLMSRPA